MQAIILAGGLGRRLEPYTLTFPKPMVPVGDMPILEIVIRQLKKAGFKYVTLAVGHLAELLMAYFGDGSKWDLKINYSREDKPLGTVGPLAMIKNLPQNFLVMNGDVLTNLKYNDLFDYHQRAGAELTIACKRCNTKIDLGVVEFDGYLKVTGYREKPNLSFDVSMGIYVFNRSILDLIKPGVYWDFPTTVNELIRLKRPVKVFISDNHWLDIGRPDDYAKATETFTTLREEFLP